jgi:hypothetical protein
VNDTTIPAIDSKKARTIFAPIAGRQMAKDYIGYQALTDAALRGVVRDALKRVEKQGLVASHHFCITFKTHFPGVEIPDFLREQYPDEMMIILQHQYSGLKVKDDHFQVTLSFRKIPATLTVPFVALTQFVDPGVQFGLQFQGSEGTAGPKAVPALPGARPAPLAVPKPAAEPPKDEEKPSAPAEVVSLDAFRKK